MKELRFKMGLKEEEPYIDLHRVKSGGTFIMVHNISDFTIKDDKQDNLKYIEFKSKGKNVYLCLFLDKETK